MNTPTQIYQWKTLAEKYVGVHPVLKPEEILAIIWNESSGNVNAINKADPSYGLMQVTMPIAIHYGALPAGSTDPTPLYDPDTNVKAGSAFLADLKTKYAKTDPITDPNCAWVAAYNEGEPNLWHRRPDPGYISAYLGHLKQLDGVPE